MQIYTNLQGEGEGMWTKGGGSQVDKNVSILAYFS